MSQPTQASPRGGVEITIYKAAQLGFITGGDYGPGKVPSNGVGISYAWLLSISELVPPDTPKAQQQEVTQTLNSVMSVIGGVAQSSCQSISLAGAGGYDGVSVTIGGTGATSSQGQLQSHGVGIDLSDVNDPPFADISVLPIGTYTATPVNGVTKQSLSLVINA